MNFFLQRILQLTGALVIYTVLLCPSYGWQKAKFDYLTTRGKQSIGKVKSIFQDQSGFLWFGSESGLKRYDGHDFMLFQYHEAESNSLVSNTINAIEQHPDGGIWVATDQGVSVMLGERFVNSFRVVPNQDDRELQSPLVHDLTFTQNGKNAWFATGNGLKRYSLEKSKFEYFSESATLRKIIAEQEVTLVTALEDELWFAVTGKGIFRLNLISHAFQQFSKEQESESQLPTNSVESLFIDRYQTIWIGTDAGLFYKERKTVGFKPFRVELEGKTYTDLRVTSVFIDQWSNIWLGTHNNGLFKWHKRGNYWAHYVSDYTDPYSLSNNSVWSIAEDETGIVWVGTSEGVNRYYRRAQSFQTLYSLPKGNPLFIGNSINALQLSSETDLWVGTNEELALLSQPHHLEASIIKQLPIPTSTLHLGTQEKWAGGLTGELLKYNLDLKQNFRNLNQFGNQIHSMLGRDQIRFLLTDCEGQLWVCTANGLHQFNQTENTLNWIPIHPNRFEPSQVNSLLEEPCGTIWIGTEKEGLVRFKKSSGELTQFMAGKGDSLSNNTINTIFKDRTGKIWIGTNRGLDLLEPESETFQHFSEPEGLSDAKVLSILEDNRGRLWIGTANGLNRFDTYYKQFKSFDSRDGLLSNQFIERSAEKLINGSLLFGTSGGVVAFHPDSIYDDNTPPRIVISSISAFSPETETDQHKNLVLTTEAGKEKKLLIGDEESILQFRFSVLHFAAPSKNKVLYQLENFDPNWISTSHREVTYMNLPSGTYTFKVKASNHDGIWEQKAASVQVVVLPPYWQTWWFLSVSFLGICGMIYLAVNLRINRIRKKKIVLERLVRQRTVELANEKDKVETALKELSHRNEEVEKQKEEINAQKDFIFQKNKLLEKAQHTIAQQNTQLKDANQQLESKIKQRTQELIDAYDEIMQTNYQIDTLMYRTAHDIKGPIARILGLCYAAGLELTDEASRDYFTKMTQAGKEMDQMLSRLIRAVDIKNVSAENHPIHFNELMEKVKENLAGKEELDKLELKMEVDPLLNGFVSDPKLLQILLECLLSNSIRYRKKDHPSPFAKVVVSHSEPHHICIRVTDNGAGISEEVKDKIFDMFYIGNTESKGAGLGLFEAKLIVEKLKGQLKLESASNNTVFKITLPTNL